MHAPGILFIASLAALPAWAQNACAPIETRPPNASGQKPAFEGQTRVCAVKSDVAFRVTVLAKGLSHPWAVEPLPGGGLLVTERPGRLRIVSAKGEVGRPIAGLPPVDARGQGGLLDVAPGPRFESDRTIYWSYAEPRRDGNGTAVARGVLSADGTRVSDVRVIFRAQPTYDGSLHFGSRLAFAADGSLFVTTGERSDFQMRKFAQDPSSDLGKVLRVDPQSGRREVWSLGHRNLQAMAFDPQGRLWVVEHGPRGGDELNLVEKGKNYGWPLVSYGEEYSGRPIANAVTQKSGFEQPRYYWDPVIAPSGAQFYSGKAFPQWRGNLFVGSLGQRRLVRLVIENATVTGEEHLLAERGRRIRDVREGPDGALYLVTDESNGELWKLAP
ncbi:MAG TPA: PQQ-dependent sugar dehydrogenase [Burkholderiales bacterium]